MSNRLKILAVLLKNGAQTYDELEMATQIERSPLRIAVNDAKKAGHISMGRDDVTHQPAYKITADGTKWLKSNAAKKAHEQTQPAVVENTGSRESVSPVGQSRPPAEVAAADRDAGASHDAPADPLEFAKYPLSVIRRVLGIDHDESIGIVPTIEALIESKNDLSAHYNISLEINRNLGRRCDEQEKLIEQYAQKTHDVISAKQNEIDWKTVIKTLEHELDKRNTEILRLERELLEAGVTADRSPPVDLTEVAIGYLVRVPKRKPRLCLKPERAHEAAAAAAKAAGRADVLALVHIGTARRKKSVTVQYTPTHQDSRHD